MKQSYTVVGLGEILFGFSFHVYLFWGTLEILEKCRAEPAFNIELFGIIPVPS